MLRRKLVAGNMKFKTIIGIFSLFVLVSTQVAASNITPIINFLLEDESTDQLSTGSESTKLLGSSVVGQSVIPLEIKTNIQNNGNVEGNERDWIGTKGQDKRLEAFTIINTSKNKTPNLNIEYMCHLQGTGDTEWLNEGDVCGTTGEERRLEGFAIRLTGTNAEQYKLRYKCHIEGSGDSEIKTDSLFCGARGTGKRVEAVWVYIINTQFIPPLQITSNIQGIGVVEGIEQDWIGTKGQNKRLEAFTINITDDTLDLNIEYMCNLESTGDTEWLSEGDMCGTTGEERRLEGFAIRLGGDDADKYDVEYKCHIEGLGESEIKADGQFCGTKGESKRIEAIWVDIVPTKLTRPLKITANIQGVGEIEGTEQDWVGTKGQDKRLEAFTIIGTSNTPNLSIEYMCHLESTGDTEWLSEGDMCGTIGEERRLEGFAIRLTGTNAKQYKLRYRCHIEDAGDSAIKTDGEFCGTKGERKRIEAIWVDITQKTIDLSSSIENGKLFLSTIEKAYDNITFPHINKFILEEGNGEWVGLKLIDTTLHIYKKGSQLPNEENVTDFFAELFIKSLFPNNPCVQKYSHGFIQNKTSEELLTNANKDELKAWEGSGVLEECSIALMFEPSLSFSIRTQNLNTSDYLDALEVFHQPVQDNKFRSRKLRVLESYDPRLDLDLRMVMEGVDLNTEREYICETEVTDPSNCTDYYNYYDYYGEDSLLETIVEISTNSSSYAEYEDFQEAIDWNPRPQLNGMCDVLQSNSGQVTDASVLCTTRVKALCEHSNNGTQELKPTVHSYLPADPDMACIIEYGPYSRAATRKRVRDEGLTLFSGIGAGVSYSKRTRTTETQKIIANNTLDFVNEIKSDRKLEDSRKGGASVLQIHSLNIGAGSCHLVQCFGPEENAKLPAPNSLLIDCGSTGSSLERLDALGVTSYFKNQEVDDGTLDIAVSHPDQDHYNFLTSLIGTDSVSNLWLGGEIKNVENYRGVGSQNLIPFMYANLQNIKKINDKENTSFTPRNEDEGILEGIGLFTSEIPEWRRPIRGSHLIKSFEACHTSLSLLNVNQSIVEVSRDTNTDSAVIELKTSRENGTSKTEDILALFPGDATQTSEEYAITFLPYILSNWKTRLVIASHHGANTEGSNSEAWIQKINPTDVIFSSGTTFSHPKQSIVESYMATNALKTEKNHKLFFGDSQLWGNDTDDTRKETNDNIFSTASSGTIIYTFVIPENANEEVNRYVDYQYSKPAIITD
jgi:uncharacterized protein YjdB/beta-lactamase superfamily II metal-dependent hydrolase